MKLLLNPIQLVMLHDELEDRVSNYTLTGALEHIAAYQATEALIGPITPEERN